MNRKISFLITMVLLMAATLSPAQKGTGNNTGIARNHSANEVIQVSGVVQKIVTEPCTQTTGRYSNGTHLLVKPEGDKSQTLNVHLGPTPVVSDMISQLETGQELHLKIYNTDDLPDNHYIAKELTGKEKVYELRDATLRPFWSGRK